MNFIHGGQNKQKKSNTQKVSTFTSKTLEHYRKKLNTEDGKMFLDGQT